MSRCRRLISKIGLRAAREGFGLFVANLSSTLILAAGSILIARLIGAEEYGLYGLSLVVPAFMVMFVSLGLNSAVVRFTSASLAREEYERISEIYGSALLFTVACSGALMLAGYGLLDMMVVYILKRPELAPLLRISLLLVLTQPLMSLTGSFLNGMGSPSKMGLFSLLQSAVKVAVSLSLITLGLKAKAAVSGHTAGYVVASVAGLIYTLRMVGSLGLKPRASVKAIREMLEYGLPIYFAFLIGGVSVQYINVVSARYLSNLEIGNYMIMSNLSAIVGLFILPISVTLFPTFSQVEAVSRDSLPPIFRLSVKYSMLIVTPVAFYLSTYSREVIGILYGGSYALAPAYVKVYTPMFLLSPLTMVLQAYLNATSQQRHTLKMSAITMGLILPTAPLLTSVYRAYGLIASLIIGNLAGVGYAAYHIARSQKVSLELKSIAEICLASAASCAASIPLSSITGNLIANLTATMAASSILYLTLLPTTRTVTESDTKNLRKILESIPMVGKVTSPIISYIEKILRLTPWRA